MRLNQIDQNQLALNRYELMRKGFVNRTDIKKFVPCGYATAKKIFKTIREEIDSSGIENLDDNIILTSRLMKFMGLSEKKIIDAYQALKKAPSADQSKSAH